MKKILWWNILANKNNIQENFIQQIWQKMKMFANSAQCRLWLVSEFFYCPLLMSISHELRPFSSTCASTIGSILTDRIASHQSCNRALLTSAPKWIMWTIPGDAENTQSVSVSGSALYGRSRLLPSLSFSLCCSAKGLCILMTYGLATLGRVEAAPLSQALWE